MQDIENYFIFSKQLIESNNNIIFDLYSYDTDTKALFIIYEKGMELSVSEKNTLMSYESIYVHSTNETYYNEFYQYPVDEKMIPRDMKDFYQNITKNINTLFNNPDSLSNVKIAKEIVTNMLDIIIKDDFTVASFVTILTYDYYTHTHSLNVSVYALCLGKHMGMKKDDLVNLGTSALLHDLGKSKISNVIINKNGPLTNSEFIEIKKHPYYGWLLAKKLGIVNQDVLDGIHYHHEKIDGSGYPKGLKKNEIPLFARIIGICDAFDAITTKRSYKDSVGTFDTLIMMKKEMSNSFDSNIINNFIKMLRG